MPKNPQQLSKQAAPKLAGKEWAAGQDHFINVDLTGEQRAQCKSLLNGEGELDSEVLRMVEAGYQITLNWDSYNQCFGCFVKAKSGAALVNEGLILTGRGSSPLKALKQAWFKHILIYDQTWQDGFQPRGYDVDD